MAKYIDAEAAQADGWRIQRFISTKESAFIETRDITSLPAADVVKVVRCRECKYSAEAMVNDKGFLICVASGMDKTDNDYCSFGTKMEVDHDQP